MLLTKLLVTNLLVIDDAILAYVPVLQFFNLLLTLEGLEDLTKAFLCCIFVVVITTIKLKSKLRNEWEESYLLLHWLRCTSPDVQRVKMRCIVSADGLKVVTKELIPTGYLPYNHRFLTSKQYKIITKHLGDPYED